MNTAESFDNIVSINLSRKDIRNERWKKKYYELDDDWTCKENEKEMGRKFGLIEFDKNKKERELSYEPKVMIDDVVVAIAKASLKIEAKEGWIKTDYYEDRDKMIQNQTKEYDHGLKDGYRVYKSGGCFLDTTNPTILNNLNLTAK